MTTETRLSTRAADAPPAVLHEGTAIQDADAALTGTYDVAVVGAGVGGVAACVLLRQAGLRVVCLDTQTYPHRKVGESLDWSSPGLLARVGLKSEDFIADGIATYKTNIVVCELGRQDWEAVPPPVIRRRPLRFETVTLQVDREAVDLRLYQQALDLGTDFVWERVSHVEHDGDRVTGCVTSGGRRIEARWYLDATGTGRLFGRALGIPKTEYGRQKVCLWTYFDTPPLTLGTTFFIDNSDPYLSWVWDIPISPRRTSVGFILPAEVMQARRRSGASNKGILDAELARFPRFRGLLEEQPEAEVESVSFRPYVSDRVCGPNWFMIGEAASMPDPLTGNGYTSAIRHARYATQAILAAGEAAQIPADRRRYYTSHVHRLGHSFNSHIENAIYSPTIRLGLGVPAATVIYTSFAFFMNALYNRFDPRRPVAMAFFKLLFLAARLWVACWSMVARIVLLFRRPSFGAAAAGSGLANGLGSRSEAPR